MSNKFFISLELASPEENFEHLFERIRESSAWAKITSSSFIIVSEETHVQIRDKLLDSMGQNDKVFVGKISAPAAWNGMGEEISSWIASHLK